MNIVYTLDNNYAPQTGASMVSILENNKDASSITFHLVTIGFTKENKEKMKSLVKKYKREVKFYEIENLRNCFNFEIDTGGWGEATVARLLMDKYLPSNIDRLLYLDGDTIVRGSLKELFTCDMQDKTIGMSFEPTKDHKKMEDLPLKGYPYCNAGVLLIDYKNWLKRNTGERLIKFLQENKDVVFAPDQDVLNSVLKDEMYYLEPKYNFFNVYDQYPYWFMKKRMKGFNYDYFDKESYIKGRNNPVIIHYLGEERPWREGNTHKYRKDYDKYLGMTAWANTPKEKGWKLYFVCWSIFNTITKPFPGLRLSIINFLIPFVLGRRAKKRKAKEKK